VFVIRDTVRHPRRFLLGKFVREQGRSRTEVSLYIVYFENAFRWSLFHHSEEVGPADLAPNPASSLFMHFAIYGSPVPFFVMAIGRGLLSAPPGVLRSVGQNCLCLTVGINPLTLNDL
jgi:hypothetical protein